METDQNQPAGDWEMEKLEEALKLWEEIRRVDQKKGWERLNAEISRKQRTQKWRLRLSYIRVAAAVVILLLSAGVIFWLPSGKEQAGVPVSADLKQPRLILENGEQILLGKEIGGDERIQKQNFVINRKGKNIIYSASHTGGEEKLQYNTLEVPRGAEYELILADGTHIWLNADTRLRYPARFGKEERRVYLEGEAYFQVARDSACPFRVESAAQTVEVLGTQFNINAYGDEEKVYTTLVQGRVAVTASLSGKQEVIRPGQQTLIYRQNGAMEIKEVDVRQVADWKEGMFVFDDQSLEVILRKVARWYDVEVFYRNPVAKSIIFKGNLPRYGELPELLKVLESSSTVHFSLQGNSLVVE